MRHRIFAGIKASVELSELICVWKKRWKKLPVRWIKPENLHITLTPPYYVENIEAAINNFSEIDTKLEPFDVSFHKICLGPDNYRPRLLWLVGKVNSEILRLKNEVEKKMKAKSQKRQFLLHLTIARINEKNIDSVKSEFISWDVDQSERIKSFELMESHLSSVDADYIVLKSNLLKRA